eukprot:CAMPEP_0114530064 /NCGR_PEP_ID=MMETSP0109-20121206/25210_1 /TAXON_ID=29199 /ORGANISM="Chlorarachnion reptans, Strain CCCM449" /LENGTH=883 /DNA_ID=CAMNT_0001712591 /DNA_START=268 /DNA_END=2919 /DNA_ORIENTATION=-
MSSARVLQLVVLRGEDLHALDSNGTSDPYVSVRVPTGGAGKYRKYKTRVIKKTLAPVWNQEFKINIDDVREKIMFKVQDWDMFSSNDHIGTSYLELPALGPEMKELKLALKNDVLGDKGHLYIRARLSGERLPEAKITTAIVAPTTPGPSATGWRDEKIKAQYPHDGIHPKDGKEGSSEYSHAIPVVSALSPLVQSRRLLLTVNATTASDPTFKLTLRGYYTKTLDENIKAFFKTLRSRVPALRRSLPDFRYQSSCWMIQACVPTFDRAEVILAVLNSISHSGFETKTGPSGEQAIIVNGNTFFESGIRKAMSAAESPSSTQLHRQESTMEYLKTFHYGGGGNHAALFEFKAQNNGATADSLNLETKLKRDDSADPTIVECTEAILDSNQDLAGGDFNEVKARPRSSTSLLPQSTIVLDSQNASLSVGVGWHYVSDQFRLYSRNELNVGVHVFNVFGERVKILSQDVSETTLFRFDRSSGLKQENHSAIRMSPAPLIPKSDDDDRVRILFNLPCMPSWVSSIVISLQSSSRHPLARGIRAARYVHCRILQPQNPQELDAEAFRMKLDTSMDVPKEAHVLHLARIIRFPSGWRLQTLGTYGKKFDLRSPGICCPAVRALHFKGFRARIPATDTQGMFGRAKQGKSDPYFKVFVEYWEKCGKMSVSLHQKPTHHGLVLQDDATMQGVRVVEVVRGSPAEASGFRPGDQIQEVKSESVSTKSATIISWLAGLEHKTHVRFSVRRGGSETLVELGMRIGGPVARRRVELWKSKTFYKMQCPAEVDFECPRPVEIKPVKMFGFLRDQRYPCALHNYGMVYFSCYDHDAMSKDDRIFHHKLSMEHFFTNGNTVDEGWFRTHETCEVDYDIRSNEAFTHCQVYIQAKVEF